METVYILGAIFLAMAAIVIFFAYAGFFKTKTGLDNLTEKEFYDRYAHPQSFENLFFGKKCKAEPKKPKKRN